MSNIGNKGRFIERLKRIAFFRRKKTIDNKSDELKIEDSNKIYSDFLKVVAAIPGIVYDSLDIDKQNNSAYIKDSSNIVNKNSRVNGKCKRQLIRDIDVNEIRSKQGYFYKNRGYSESVVNENIDTTKGSQNSIRVKELEKSIINLIKKDLIKIVNEMEILQSELYILSEVNGESRVLEECQRELDQVKSILCKIDKLKEKYDFLKDNYDFEYLLEIDNNDLVDKIIELRDTFGNNELKAVSEDYKLLDVYRYLYLKIDDFQKKTADFLEEKKEEELKLKERNIDFEKLKIDVYNIENINRDYESFVDNQRQLLSEIDNNVDKINSYEHIDSHLKGFGALFRNTFKYFGLLMLSPLKGIIPSIATETLITGNLIKNLYNNLQWEENRKMVYEAIDYSSMINNAINDLDSTSRIVDATLDDIVRLKIKYNERFKKYQGDFSQYREIIHKINDMENKIMGNKIKIEMMKKRALEQKRANDKKLVLVKQLTEKENQK